MIHELLKYNYKTNHQLAQYLHGLNPNSEIKKLFNHILMAQKIWNNRILNINIDNNTILAIESDGWIVANEDFYKTSMDILNSKNGDEIIVYKNLAGEQYQNTVNDIMIHICNHATYHRGQIAVLLRQNNIQPLPTDFIVYKRIAQ